MDIDTTGIDNIVRLDVEEGDYIIVTMPEMENVPRHISDKMTYSVRDQFEETFKDKKVNIAVIPFGMKVEYFSASMLEDNE